MLASFRRARVAGSGVVRDLERSILDAAVAAAERDAPGARELDDAEVAEHPEQRLELLGLARGLECQRPVRHVDDVHTEHVGDLHDPGAVVAVGAHLHEHQLALDGRSLIVLEDLDHVDQLVQLLRDLLERLLLDVDDDRHPGDAGALGGADRERVDVEAARSEQARDPGENSRPVFDQHGDRVQVAVHTIGASPGVSCGANSGPRMMSSFDVPAATIGNTPSRGSTRKSITTLRSSMAYAFSIVASTSSGVSTRSPTAP